MSTTLSVEEAQARLQDLINQLSPGDEVIITRNQKPIAKLVPEKAPLRQPRQPGSAVGKFFILAEDEDHLQDFREYMP